MSAHVPKFPDREVVAQQILKLIDGSIGRDEVARWASHWLLRFDQTDFDRKLFDAIDSLSGADAISTDRPYLYDISDFERWLGELTSDQ
jgi:hypothetical protein